MGRWYKDEYEAPIVFIFAIIGALTPWQISTATTQYGSYNVIRWWFGEFRVTTIEGASGFVPTHVAVLQQQATTVYPAFIMGAIGSVLAIGTLLLALSFLIDEEAVTEAIPVDYVAAFLFGAGGLFFLGSTIWMATNGIPSTPIPVGALFYIIFAGFIYYN